jgi:hypothetical protein
MISVTSGIYVYSLQETCQRQWHQTIISLNSLTAGALKDFGEQFSAGSNLFEH